MRGRRVVALAAVLLGLVPGTASAAEVTVGTGVEAWYHITAGNMTGLPPVNPYPEDTLHVGVSGGSEESRTYLTLDLFDVVPEEATISGGTLEAPVDPGGSVGLEAARVAVCFVADPPPSVEGSLEPPPEVDCSAGVSARYSDGRFVADLGPLAGRLRSGGLALVASAEAGDSWHLSFYGKDHASPEAISATLTYSVPVVAPSPAPAPPDTGGAGSGIGFPDVPFEEPSPFAAPELPREPAVAEPPPVDEFVEEATDFGESPGAYLSWVLLLPLLLLFFVAYFGRALTLEAPDR